MQSHSLKTPFAIVVLGCRLGSGGYPSSAAARRIDRAARAYFELEPACVVLSGGRLWHGVAEADGFGSALEARGVPRSVLVRELCSLSTLENAVYSAALSRAGGFSDIGIVTCDWHMPRALACFRAMGIRATPLPAVSPSTTPIGRAVRGLGERIRVVLDRAATPHWVDG
jgi:uncharacterized SAM-binding protein YcdF (DUF218 family)